jgi:ENTH domain
MSDIFDWASPSAPPTQPPTVAAPVKPVPTSYKGGIVEAKQKLQSFLFDETKQILSSFELNQIASLTYGEEVCDAVYEVLEQVVKRYLQNSPLALQKALALSHHLLLYGASRVVNYTRAHIGPCLEFLRTYNTALIEQQQTGITSLWYQIKGGGVDRGGPVREAAEQLLQILSLDDRRLQQERARHADPASLVPIGKTSDVAFVTDEVRLAALQRQIERQRTIQLRSNLAKADNGFGGGYNPAAPGQAVVGAAHSLEEMMAHAKRAEQKFSDDGIAPAQQSYSAPSDIASHHFALPAPSSRQPQRSFEESDDAEQTTSGPDLLSLNDEFMSKPASQAVEGSPDLLDFASASDLYSSSIPPQQHDPFGLATYSIQKQNQYHGAAPLAYQGLGNGLASDLITGSTGGVAAPLPSSLDTSTGSANLDPFSVLDVRETPPSLNTLPNPQETLVATSMPLNTLPPTTAPFQMQLPVQQAPVSVLSSSNKGNQPAGGAFADLMTAGFGATGSSVLPHKPMPVMQTLGSLSSLRVSSQPVPPSRSDDDDGFVMGGYTGSGLEPTAPPPNVPPPPPPTHSNVSFW